MLLGWKNPMFTETGIWAAGLHPARKTWIRHAVIYGLSYPPFKKHPKYTGFMALYVHDLYVLGKIRQRQYPPE